MPTSEKAQVEIWNKRVLAADKLYKSWSDEYKTKNLEQYYNGKQWQGVSDDDAKKRYVINMVYATVETNKPSMIFANPVVKMSARKCKLDDPASMAAERAQLCQDTVQTFIDDPDVDFVNETALALHEAHFRFGVVEVGYTPDWIDNPDAGKPVLREREDDDPEAKEPEPVKDSNGVPVMQPAQIIKSEFLYVKQIPADQFRVAISNKNKLSRNDWVGYFEWHYVEDIKRNPLYKVGARGLKPGGSLKPDYREGDKDLLPEEREARNGMVKVWKIWSLRNPVRHVLAEGHDKFLLKGQPYRYLPFSILKFHEILKSFYPLPPVSQWMGPQDEVNETRDSQRAHRRRFYRRYTTMRNAVDPEEMEKFETGGDGVVVIVNQPNAFKAVEDAPLGADVWAHLDSTKQDFMTVSGVGGDQRGIPESETATQANIINQRFQLRESAVREKVRGWLSDIARLMLLTIRDKMTLDFWILRNVDLPAVDENAGVEVQRVAQLWQQIEAEDLGNLDLDITIDLTSMSPVAQEQEKQNWLQVLQLISQPGMAIIFAASPTLLNKTLRMYNITSSNEIAEIQKVLQMLVVAQMAQAQAEAGAPGPGGKSKKPNGAAGPGAPKQTPAETGGEPLH